MTWGVLFLLKPVTAESTGSGSGLGTVTDRYLVGSLPDSEVGFKNERP